MTSPVKKVKKKSVVSPQLGNFDIRAILPSGLDEKDKALMEQFFLDGCGDGAEREAAIQKFVKGVMDEHQKLEEEAQGTSGGAADSAPSSVQPNKPEEVVDNSPETKTSPELEPQSDSLSEERQRINVGWMTGPSEVIQDLDKKVASYSQKLGCQLYNFVSYPIGGVIRSFWKFSQNDPIPPPNDLPDLQLQNHLWETYINGAISEWIDCDSPDEQLARLSEVEMLKELNYAVYMGLRSVVVIIRRASSPRLTTLLNKWLWTKNVNMAIWVLVPTSLSQLVGEVDENLDCWEIWANFRTACSNFSSAKLIAGLHIASDLDDEFVDPKLLARWRAEPLAAFMFESDIFVTNQQTNKAELPDCHSRLLQDLWMSNSSRVLVRASAERDIGPQNRLHIAQSIRSCLRNGKSRPGISDQGFLSDGNIDYMDVLQAPLQPLADNLDSGVYNTFEQDPIKYKRYRESIEAFLKDFGESAKRPESVVVYVLGAGRGPLVTMSFEAEKLYNEKYRSKKDRLKLKVLVVEKNTNAIVTLRFMNEKAWRNRCTIVESDMRSLPAVVDQMDFPKPDLIVSELLGSFGDNELSPECLDGVTDILKPSTISIPSSYTSYIAPIMSSHMHQTILSTRPGFWSNGIPGHGREGTTQLADGTFCQDYKKGQKIANLDQIYVVFLRQYCALTGTKKIFTFDHPNFDKKSNVRHKEVSFTMDRSADIMGFAGYFHMTLYKDITLSIEPSTYSKGMISWFPALIPLRGLQRVHEGDEVTFFIDRKVDGEGVWYEWFMQLKDTRSNSIRRTDLQNENGESYYMRLFS